MPSDITKTQCLQEHDIISKFWGYGVSGDRKGVGVENCKTLFLDRGHFLFTCFIQTFLL